MTSSALKFRESFRFEFRYQLRNISTWLLLGAVFLFGFLLLRMVMLEDGTHLNAPGTITFFTVFASAIWVVIGGVVAGDAATRDMQTRIHPLTFTTPVTRFSYLSSRFLGALAINVCIMLFLYAGMLLSYYGPGAKTAYLGPFRLVSYTSNFFFLAFPTVFATTAIQFACAALSGRAVASYIASIVIIFFSQFAGTTVRFALDWKVLGSLMDLLGTSIVMEMEGWTPLDKNNRLATAEGTWLWNRVAWMTVAFIALAVTYLEFQITHVTSGTHRIFPRWLRRSKAGTRSNGMATIKAEASYPLFRSVGHIFPVFNRLTYFHQVRAISVDSFKAIAWSRGGLTLVGILALGTGLFATEYMEWLGVPLQARTEEVLRILTHPLNSYKTQWIIIPLLIIFYAGEIIWRERETGLNELADTTPVPESVVFVGKFFGLAIVIAVWVLFLLLAGLINQVVMEYYKFEPGLYLVVLFGIQYTNYLLFALLVFVIHVFINQKYIGYMVALGTYGFILFASTLGIEHKLLVFGSDTGLPYSDMRGFEPFVKPWMWFKLYWWSWALFLATVAILFWVRSKEVAPRKRIELACQRLINNRLAPAMMFACVVASAGYIFYNTNIRNTYLTHTERLELRAGYERLYGQFVSAPRPMLEATRLSVSVYPDEHRAEIECTYRLVNRTAQPIDSIHLSTIPFSTVNGLTFDRKFSEGVVDTRHGYRIYLLEEPLDPGDATQMHFSLRIENNGFTNAGVDESVTPKVTFIDNGEWMPVIGFQDDRRIQDRRDREKHRLPARVMRPSPDDEAARRSDTRHAGRMEFEAVVSTKIDQIAIAPGELKREWIEGDRRYFHYVANKKILNEYAIFSSRYSVTKATWIPPSAGEPNSSSGDNVTIEVYYHPSHNINIDRMMKSAELSLEYYSKLFGPYPYNQFRVIERPGAGRGMHAEPMTIDYQEGYSLMNPRPGGIDLPYHIMAHEAAHQWWGIGLVPAAVEGSAFIVESLATYSAMLVVEDTRGYDDLMRYLSQMRLEYEVPRSRAAPPMLQANNRFMSYRKGPFALFALRNYIGKENVNLALQEFIGKHLDAPVLPTTIDLYRELQAVTPDSLQYLIHDLFAANTFWELETLKADAGKVGNSWRVTFEVNARKVVVDSIGIETEIPMNDWIELGAYPSRREGEKGAHALYLQKHRIHSGKNTISFEVPQLPASGGIDPNHLLIDLDLDDNTSKIKVGEEMDKQKKPGLI